MSSKLPYLLHNQSYKAVRKSAKKRRGYNSQVFQLVSLLLIYLNKQMLIRQVKRVAES